MAYRYWKDSLEVEKKAADVIKVTRLVSSRRYQDKTGKSEAAWASTAEAKALFEEEAKRRIYIRAIERQADLIARDQLPPPTFDIRFRRMFISIFTWLASGVGVNQGRRDTRDQSAFRAAMISDYGAGHPDPAAGLLWCCITKK
jgi:hypothetical protein